MVESKNTELSQGTWLNKPKSVFQEAGKVTLETDEKTDFWRETFTDLPVIAVIFWE